MLKIKVGKVKNQQENAKSWLVGQFFPDTSPFQDKNVEIYYKTLNKSEFTDKLHYHPHGKEYLFVINGSVKIQIGEGILKLKTGDYVAIESNVNDKIISFTEGTKIFGVRTPSVINNKVFLE